MTIRTTAVTSIPSLRPSRESDGEFFYDLVKQTMFPFIVQTWGAWDDSRVRAEALEFGASSEGEVIEAAGSQVGVLLTRQASDHVYVRLLCIAPGFQRRGIGSLVLNTLASRAAVQRRSLHLRVMTCNPARAFYDGLGFETTEATPQFVYMRRAWQAVECPSPTQRSELMSSSTDGHKSEDGLAVLLRLYQDDDWDAVCEIYNLGKLDEMDGVVPKESILPLEVDLAMQNLFRNSQIMIAEVATRVAGFAGCRGSYITWLFVHPVHRRIGVAKALIGELLVQLPEPVTLHVMAGNLPARRLYERMGFKVDREFQSDYQGLPCQVAKLRYGTEKI